MSVHIDLLIPSFSFPLSHSDCNTTSSSSSDRFILNDNTIQFLHSQCINAFGVDKGELELFQLFNNQNEIRVGCLINGYKINMDTISHTMQQNKILNELLSKTTDAMLHLQQQRDREIVQLLEKTSELAELKVTNIELQNEIKTMQTQQTKQQQQILQLQQHNQLLIDNKHPEGTRLYHLLDDNNNNNGKHSGSKFMDRLLSGSHTINTNTSSITSNLANTHISHSNSLAASAPATSSAIHLSPAPHSSSSLSSSPPNPNPPPNPATPVVYNSPLIPPALDLGDSPSNPSSSVNNEMVADNLRKKLISFARDGPYYAYSNSNNNINSSNNINNSNLPRPSTGSRPSPPAGPKPHLSPRMGRVLSRSTLQFDIDQTNGKDEPFPFPFPFPPAVNPSSRASTPKNIRGSTPSNRSSSSSPRRASYADPPQYHHPHPLQSSIRSPSPPRPPSSASSHDHLIVTPLRGSSSKYT